MENYIKIHPKDNVAVALTDLPAGTSLQIEQNCLQLTEAIPQGHKFALKEIKADQAIIKYGSSHRPGKGDNPVGPHGA